MSKVPTPTLDKIQSHLPASEAIGAFLDWLTQDRKLVFAEHLEGVWSCEHCGPVKAEEVVHRGLFADDTALWRHRGRLCRGLDRVTGEGGDVDHQRQGLYPAPVTIDALLHEYFAIDPAAEERERRALLEELRADRG